MALALHAAPPAWGVSAWGVSAWGASAPAPTFPLRQLAPGVYAVLGDTGRGSEGRANAGFIVTREGVVVVDAEGSPKDGATLLQTIRSVTKQPVRWLVLTHHHPDHHFGAIVFRKAGATVIAHPDTRTLQSEAGPDDAMIDWIRVVGLDAMRGFEYANTPDHPVTDTDTLRLGGRTIVINHPGPAHTPGDLTVWLPQDRVLFAGDLLIEDGVTMLVDGQSPALLAALDGIDALHPRVVVPGHGAIPLDPAALVQRTREYVTALRADMRKAVEQGTPMTRALAALPPADQTRPVSRNSRKRRNALRVYLEMEREMMGLGKDSGADATSSTAAAPTAAAPTASSAPQTLPPARLLSTDSLAAWQRRGSVLLVDTRLDPFIYLKSHLPGAVYLNTETLRAADRGVPMQILADSEYRQIFSRVGLRWDRPVVVYSAGESRNIDATFLVWLLQSLGHAQVYLLDGGFFKWQLEQRPLATHYPQLEPAPRGSAPFQPPRASLGEVRRAAATRGVLLVDARPPDQFAGDAGAQMRRGHIPGAINHYWQDDLEQEGFGRVFKPLAELRRAYEAQGITPDKDLILYCNSTTEASHLYFTLYNLLGYRRVRIYSGSWTEWAEREELPIETGRGR